MTPSEIIRRFYDGEQSILEISARPDCRYEVHEIEMLLRGYIIGLRDATKTAEPCAECGA
jgi:hypothetical protein